MGGFHSAGVRLPRAGVPGFLGTKLPAQVANFDAPIFYVNADHPLANDANDGTSPDEPLATIQSIIDRTAALIAGTGTRQPVLQSYSSIYVSSEEVAEDVQFSGLNIRALHLVGVGGHFSYPYWTGAVDGVPNLDIATEYMRISGFRFRGKTGSPAILLRRAFEIFGYSTRCMIDNNHFLGWVGDYGIQTEGADYFVTVKNNTFERWHNTGGNAACMYGVGVASPVKYNVIENNLFLNSDNGVIWPGDGCVFRNNVFAPDGADYAMAQILNTATVAEGGDNNIVTGNVLPGDYSIAGGYRGGAADVWSGNFAADIAEAEVGDNGLTILPPA